MLTEGKTRGNIKPLDPNAPKPTAPPPGPKAPKAKDLTNIVKALMTTWHFRVEREREQGMIYTARHYEECLTELEDATGIKINDREKN